MKLINSIRNGQKKTELLVYAALWTLLFIAPLLSMYAQNAVLHQSTYDWFGVRMSWRVLSMFAVYFAIHNFLIAPLLVYGGRKWLYGVIVVVGLAGFELYLCSTRPSIPSSPVRNGTWTRSVGDGPIRWEPSRKAILWKAPSIRGAPCAVPIRVAWVPRLFSVNAKR